MKYKIKRKTKYIVLETMKILFGTAILAAGISLLLLPNQLSTGGFTGLATITYYLFKIPLGTTILVLNIPLFILLFIKNGKSFFIKAIIGTLMLSVFLDFFEKFGALTDDRFLACIYGGIITGIGSAIVLKAKASTRRNRFIVTNSKSL